METKEQITVRYATSADAVFATLISDEMEASAMQRGSGIAKRSVASIIKKMEEGRAIIALDEKKQWAGFSYFDVWDNGNLVSNSGLIVSPMFRGKGIASKIKRKLFALTRRLFPKAKIFSITSGMAIMKMNAELGFKPVTFDYLPKEPEFWQGCSSCVNYSILQSKSCKNCLCTAMLYSV